MLLSHWPFILLDRTAHGRTTRQPEARFIALGTDEKHLNSRAYPHTFHVLKKPYKTFLRSTLFVTMAELGAVANGIALATIVFQVGDGLLRFKRFWDDVKSAPEDISYLLEEIEAQYLVISDISNRPNGMDVASISATNCFHLYQRTASTLEKVVNELEETIRERKILGGIKTTLKKGTVNGLRERLRNVQSLLMLSNQVYLGYGIHNFALGLIFKLTHLALWKSSTTRSKFS